jgi:hypothetical protein
MIFSAGFDSFRCTQCKAECQNVIPTSILPMMAVCGFSGSYWARLLRHWLWDHWFFNIVGFAVAFLTLWLIYEIIERVTNHAVRSGHCPRCGSALERIGGGFYDGCAPNPWELMIYGFTIAMAIGVSALSSAFAQCGG